MSNKHHMHMVIPAKLNDWLEKQKEERGVSKTVVVIQLIEAAAKENAG